MKKALVLCTTLAIAGATVARADTAFSTRDYDLYAGDFDGDGLSDVLYVAHDPNRLSGIALSDRTGFNTPLRRVRDRRGGFQRRYPRRSVPAPAHTG
jgi:hypothetical protein